MSPSIRTYLLINLLLSVTLVTSMAIIGNLFLTHNDIQKQLDAQLIRSALRIRAFLSMPLSGKTLRNIQSNLNNENKKLRAYEKIFHINEKTMEEALNSLEFQVWNQKGKLILHSKNAPKKPFSSKKNGISTLWFNDQYWYISSINQNRYTVMVAERSDYRQALENTLTHDSIIVMLVTYPFLGFLIWVIVGRGLETVRRVAQEVSHRAPSYLEPVSPASVPTEIEPLVSELNKLFLRLKSAFEHEKHFTADAAHELKTPLAALSAQTQVALRATTEEEKKQALLKVLSGVQRSTHVVQQLLTLSRLEPDSGLSETTDVVLAKATAEVAGMLAPEALAKNIELELLSPENSAVIHGNATAIHILIRNLVDNAIRYSPPGSYVKINITDDSKTITLSVIDNGPGIPESLRKRVFERFFRVLGNQTTGSGLGLSIVAQIVKLHQGSIEITTPPSGQGAEFRVVFPKK